MLKLESVTKTYSLRGQPVVGLDNVTLRVPAGDFVAIVGPSGSGKSTLLLTLGAMMAPTAGTVLFEEQPLYDLPPVERAQVRREKMGFLFQTFNLVPYLSAQRNVQLPLLLTGADAAAQEERAAALLARVGLADRLDHKPAELSVGQQQRVALARMLANDPPLILADEPTGSLDPTTTGEVIEFLRELNAEGRTIVMVTHTPQAAASAKRTVRLNAGALEPGTAVAANAS